MTMMIGYLRQALVHADDVPRVENLLRQCAQKAGAAMHDMVRHEPAPPTNPLWVAMVEWDRRHGTRLIATVIEVAARDGIDLRPMIGGGKASFRVLWAAIEELQAGGGGYLVVPSIAHLDGLATPRQDLLRMISDIRPPVGVMEADAIAPGFVDALEVIGEFEVPPAPLAEEIARATTRRRLVQHGLSHMVGPVDALMRALVRTVTEPDHLAAQDHLLTIRIQRDPAVSGLVVTCLDTRGRFADIPPHRAVVGACGHGRVVRTSWGTGTSTRCELPILVPQTGSVVAVAGR